MEISHSNSNSIGVNPVFFRDRDIPRSDSVYTSVLEICVAAERICGKGSVIVAQKIKGQWRLYAATRTARNNLLIKGLVVRDTLIKVSDTNLFSLRENGQEIPTTKVWIDNVPISVADNEFEHSLKSIGCDLRSAIIKERARDADGK